MIKFTNHIGNKIKFSNLFNDLTRNLNKRTYVELYFGSGAIFFNLDITYDKYIINDINRNLIRVLISFRDNDFTDYSYCINNVIKNFGDYTTDKDAYYNFRDWFNNEHWNQNTDEEGFYLHMLMNSCLNSLMRFGPNGFNQSFGNRGYRVTESDFTKIKKRLSNRTEILNKNGLDIIENFDLEDVLLFLDPPYDILPNVVGRNDMEKFIDKLKGLKKCACVYTDVYSNIHEKLGWDNEIIGKVKKVAGNSNREGIGHKSESYFINFEHRNGYW